MPGPIPVKVAELAEISRKTPAQIIGFFRRKNYKISWNWREVWKEEHARAFTVAKSMRKDILDVLRAGVDHAITQGWSQQRFIRELTPALQKLGWWGQQSIINPSGALELIQLGSPWRLKTIYRTNLLSSFGRGRFALLKANAVNRPYWMYDAVNDSVTRDTHRALDNKVYRHDHPVWEHIYPPNGFNCRCQVRALTEDQVRERGLTPGEPQTLPEGFPDEGWNYNPAEQSIEQLAAQLNIPKPRPIFETLAPESLEPGARAAKREAWVDQYSSRGALDSPRLQRMRDLFDDPAIITNRRDKAFYLGGTVRSISMADYLATTHTGRSVFRHEWGHYLDNRIGYLRREVGAQFDAFKTKFLGKVKSVASYATGHSIAISAIQSDAARLLGFGKRNYKKWINAASRARQFNQGMIDSAWHERYRALFKDLGQLAKSEIDGLYQIAVKNLEADRGLIGAVWRALRDKGAAPGKDWTILMAQAAKENDLSFLLQQRGGFLRKLFDYDITDKGDWGHFSDLVGAMTREKVGGWKWGPGHGKDYYARDPDHYVGTEAFANMTSLEKIRRQSPLHDRLISELFPEFSRWYDEMIDALLELGG